MSSSEVARAMDRALRLYPRSAGFRKVYLNGARARIAGRDDSTCPYSADGKGTWRRSYRRAWLRGYQSVSAR